MARDHDERPNPESDRDEVQCELRLQPDPRDETRDPVVERIPGRLLGRLRLLARAHELPLLGRLPDHGAVGYPEVQLSTLEDELELLFRVESDQALLAAIRPLLDLIERGQQDPRGWSLIVETP